MPWSDLSHVTAVLANLLDLNIRLMQTRSLPPGAPPPPPVTVVATPPDQIGTTVSNMISLYLHHVRETAATQNMLGPGNDVPNIRTAPLGLDLFYVLTAHHRTNALFDAGIEQQLMGYALKTLHDWPVLTDASAIGGTQVFGNAHRGRNNRLNIELRKLEPDQSFAIWTTGDRQFARLAAYYQIGLVLLEPEPPERMPGMVLSVGAFVTPLGTIWLSGSRSELSFGLPPSAGGGTQTLRPEPGRPALTSAPGPDSTITMRGENLTAGLRQRLVFRNARWQRLAPPADRVPIDPALNVANGWTVQFHPDRVEVQVGLQVTYVPPDGAAARTIDVFPGSYAAYVEAVADEKMLAGQLRRQSVVSNEVAFGIMPRIRSHTIAAATNRVTVAIEPGFQLNVGGGGVAPLEIQVVVDGRVYARRGTGPFTTGTFRVLTSSLALDAHFPVTVSGEHTVRLTVEGVDAQPYWVVVP